MAVCRACKQEMQDQVGCTLQEEEVAGTVRPRVPYGQGTGVDYAHEGRPCHDCLCPVGTFHHPGCDAESCPSCSGQAISCGCYGIGEDEGEDEETEPTMTPEEEEELRSRLVRQDFLNFPARLQRLLAMTEEGTS